ncbi:TPA: hypothetical protein UMX25_003909 [Stenotrophomonas maltophilia]|uniref:hypothetical protein n=1 Tax=Stenotrophomonas maltophilia TaxID=40324 RepID=UPI002A9252A0|nr:hypothetical protein [Stenotrophomonas maltophilia]HEL4228828.1 hypothetical protein [Stenotrophomonas maltophilia]
MVQAGAAGLGIGAAAAVEFGGWCLLNPIACSNALKGTADALAADFVGGHTISVPVAAGIAAKAGLAAEETISTSRAASRAYESAKGVSGFKYGITAEEVRGINQKISGAGEYWDVSTTIANAANYEGFYNNSAVFIRDIAGGHGFVNGNKRTAVEVFEVLVERNAVDGPPRELVWKVVDRVSTGELKSIDEISKALRGLE